LLETGLVWKENLGHSLHFVLRACPAPLQATIVMAKIPASNTKSDFLISKNFMGKSTLISQTKIRLSMEICNNASDLTKLQFKNQLAFKIVVNNRLTYVFHTILFATMEALKVHLKRSFS
jgi:hypothetical protein